MGDILIFAERAETIRIEVFKLGPEAMQDLILRSTEARGFAWGCQHSSGQRDSVESENFSDAYAIHYGEFLIGRRTPAIPIHRAWEKWQKGETEW